MLQCPANHYSDVPNTLPNCTACASGNTSEVGSTDASQCRVKPLLKGQAQLTAETAAKLTAETTAREASEERNAAKKRENLIIISSAIAVVLLMVFGGAWLYYFHRNNLALTKQLNESILTQVTEQHEEMVHLRNWR